MIPIFYPNKIFRDALSKTNKLNAVFFIQLRFSVKSGQKVKLGEPLGCELPNNNDDASDDKNDATS